MLDQIQEIWALHQLSGEVMVDIGGGFPYQHEVPFEDQSFQPVAFFQKLAGAWKLPTKPHLVVEPGRVIAAPSMMLVSTVLATKHRPEATLVVLDSGTNLLPIASEFNHLIHFPETAGHSEPFVICGPLCSEEDVFAGLYQAPIPDAGCIVVISNAGAYSVALASTFIQPRPPILTLGESDSLSLTVNRETMEQAYALVSTLPPKLLEEEEGGVR
jgi:diaminopimelate decarboxylase